MRSISTTFCPFWAITCVILIAGCGEAGVDGATVDGAVTIDGTPIADGSLEFIPQQEGSGPAAGAQIVDGRYTADQVPLGQVRVIIRATKKTGRMVTDYSEPYEEEVSIVPSRYAAGEVIEVSGNMSRDFALTSQ